MSTINEIHQEANRLRKGKNFAEALPLYDKVWAETGDKYDGAGLLSCLRKLKLYDRAIPLAKDLIKRFPDFGWVKNEVIWTYVSGKLKSINEKSPLDVIIKVANEILSFEPVDLARKITVFRILKAAKSSGNWECVYDWTDKLSPDNLSTEPMVDDRGRKGWCDQSLWYNYRAKSLIEIGKPEEVLEFIDETIEKHPKQKKFFFRLKALALYKLEKFKESEECYKSLCARRQVDWWLLHEYAKVVRDRGGKEQAIKLMCRASASNRKLELMVGLFKDIGFLCKDIGNNEVSRAHFALSALIRGEQEWSVPDDISQAMVELNSIIGNDDAPVTIKEAYANCYKEWVRVSGPEEEQHSNLRRKSRRDLMGVVSFGSKDRSFCFIQAESESFFCFKSDIPKEVSDGETVYFSAVPSFDKKKNRDSWRATNISKIN